MTNELAPRHDSTRIARPWYHETVAILARLFDSPWFIAAVFLAASIPLYSGRNGFGFYYHADEPGKVEQIITGKHNFNHPLLLVMTASAFVPFVGKSSQLPPQTVARAGRFASALFSALAVTALALLAREFAGALAAWMVGLISLCNPLLFELAHIIKEDPALAMGLALGLLSFQVFWRRQDKISLAFLGIACGVTVSAKYVGIVLLPFALLVVLASPAEGVASSWTRIRLFLLAFALTLVVINFDALFHPHQAIHRLVRETQVHIPDEGLSARRLSPHLGYVEIYLHQVPTVISLLASLYLGTLVIRFRRLSPVQWTVALLPFLFVAILSFSPTVEDRYFLPSSILIFFMAGMGGTTLARWAAAAPGRWSRTIQILVCSVVLGASAVAAQPRIASIYQSFGAPDQVKLRVWIRQNLPATAIIAQDAQVGLPEPQNWKFAGEEPLPQKVVSSLFVADLGTLETLKSQGVTHVAITAKRFHRFTGSLPPMARREDHYLRRKAFYNTLRQAEELIWSSPPGTVDFLNPGLELYQLRDRE